MPRKTRQWQNHQATKFIRFGDDATCAQWQPYAMERIKSILKLFPGVGLKTEFPAPGIRIEFYTRLNEVRIYVEAGPYVTIADKDSGAGEFPSSTVLPATPPHQSVKSRFLFPSKTAKKSKDDFYSGRFYFDGGPSFRTEDTFIRNGSYWQGGQGKAVSWWRNRVFIGGEFCTLPILGASNIIHSMAYTDKLSEAAQTRFGGGVKRLLVVLAAPLPPETGQLMAHFYKISVNNPRQNATPNMLATHLQSNSITTIPNGSPNHSLNGRLCSFGDDASKLIIFTSDNNHQEYIYHADFSEDFSSLTYHLITARSIWYLDGNTVNTPNAQIGRTAVQESAFLVAGDPKIIVVRYEKGAVLLLEHHLKTFNYQASYEKMTATNTVLWEGWTASTDETFCYQVTRITLDGATTEQLMISDDIANHSEESYNGGPASGPNEGSASRQWEDVYVVAFTSEFLLAWHWDKQQTSPTYNDPIRGDRGIANTFDYKLMYLAKNGVKTLFRTDTDSFVQDQRLMGAGRPDSVVMYQNINRHINGANTHKLAVACIGIWFTDSTGSGTNGRFDYTVYADASGATVNNGRIDDFKNENTNGYLPFSITQEKF